MRHAWRPALTGARSRSILFALLAAVPMSLAGCADVTAEDAGTTPTQRRAAVYAAAFRAFLEDSADLVAPPTDVYVVGDARVQSGPDPERGSPIGPALRQALAERVGGIAHLTWVEDQARALELAPGRPRPVPCFRVRDKDMVVTLDRLPRHGDRLEVSVSAVGHEFGHQDCAVGWLRTYVVEADGDTWQVTGTTTPSGGS